MGEADTRWVEGTASLVKDHIFYPDRSRVGGVGDTAKSLVEAVSQGLPKRYQRVAELNRDYNMAQSQGDNDLAEQLDRRLNLLTQVSLEAITSGSPRPGANTPDYAAIAGAGSTLDVNRALPRELVGLGERIRNHLISNQEVQGVLNSLDRVRQDKGWDRRPPRAEKVLEEYESHYERLAALRRTIGENHQDRGQLDMAMAYLEDKMQQEEMRIGAGGQQQGRDSVEGGRQMPSEVSTDIEIPTSPESQLRYVRTILDTLEATNRDTGDYAIATRVHYLESIADRLSPEVAREVKARIALVDCYALMRKANGWIEQPPSGGMTMGGAAQIAYERNHDLSREVMEFFFARDSRSMVANGLPIDRAWDLLQEANFKYEEMIDKVAAHFGRDPNRMKRDFTVSFDDDPSLGRVETNFYVDGNDERKNLVREYIVERLGGGYQARKALQLAERLIYATAEASVINRGSQTGNDQLAEAIGLHAYRRSRAHTGRNRGPELHIDEIPGFGISWIRQFSRVTNVNSPLFSKDILPGRIEEGNYLYYYSVWVSAKIHPLREEVLNIAPDPKKMLSRGFFQRAVDYFNKADPPYDVVRVPDRNVLPHEVLLDNNGDKYIKYKGRRVVGVKRGDELVFDFGGGVRVVAEKTKEGKKRLRSWYIAGVVQMASTEGSLGWTLDDVQDLGNLVSRERYAELSEEAGTFISRESWNWIMKINDAPSEMRKMEARRRSRRRAGRG